MESKRYCMVPAEDRSHTVYRYTNEIYKVIQWYQVRERFGPGPADKQKHHDKKLDSSVSRTKRVILEKALCNPWEWFCTFTISADKYDRHDLSGWYTDFSQWMRDQRKKGKPIQYLIVPETHKDGTWHAHGLFSGLSESDLISFKQMDKNGYRSSEGRRLPPKLRNSEYLNWMEYMEKFGFCSFGKIQNHVAAGFYITKYITKDNDRMVQDVGLHSYYASRGLQGATKHLDFYGRDPVIDKLLVNKYDFCATGMTHVKHNLDWSFCMEFVDITDLEPLELSPAYESEKTSSEVEADSYYEFEQLVLRM